MKTANLQMRKLFRTRAALISAAACLLVCEPVPQTMIDDARNALEKAEKSGARAIAASQLDLGHVLYDSAMKQLAVEKKKLPFTRSYKKIIDLLDVAAEAGYYAVESQQAEHQTLKDEFKERLDQSKGLADMLDTMLISAAAGRKEIGLLQAFLDSARSAQKEAAGALDSGDLTLAEEKVVAAEMKTAEADKKISVMLTLQKKSAGKRKL